jgi:hypothetical protein
MEHGPVAPLLPRPSAEDTRRTTSSANVESGHSPIGAARATPRRHATPTPHGMPGAYANTNTDRRSTAREFLISRPVNFAGCAVRAESAKAAAGQGISPCFTETCLCTAVIRLCRVRQGRVPNNIEPRCFWGRPAGRVRDYAVRRGLSWICLDASATDAGQPARRMATLSPRLHLEGPLANVPTWMAIAMSIWSNHATLLGNCGAGM